MDIKEALVIPPQTDKLAEFSSRKFHLTLSGFEVLSLMAIANRIGGCGKVRSVFSSCGGIHETSDHLLDLLEQVEGSRDALHELESHIKTPYHSHSITIDDRLR